MLVACLDPQQASAQAVLNPATINVTTSFINPAGPVRDRLQNAAGPGPYGHYGVGVSSAPVRVATASAAVPAAAISNTLDLTVDATGSPTYRIQSYFDLRNSFQRFLFTEQTTGPIAPGSLTLLTMNQVVSIVTFQFGQAVNGGAIDPVNPGTGLSYGGEVLVPAGSTQLEFVAPAGVPVEFRLGLEVGSGGRVGTVRRVKRTISTWNAGLPSDQLLTVNLNLNDGSGLGSLTGTFDVVGETELSLPIPGDTYDAGYSNVTAYFVSPQSNASWARRVLLSGSPSSGAFTLANLTNSASANVADPGSSYVAQGEAFLTRTLPSGAKGVEFFRTGLVAAPVVPGSLGNALNITPGVVSGTILLQAPAAQVGSAGMLTRVLTAADDPDANNDGVPDTYVNPLAWLNRSKVVLIGTGPAANQAQASMVLNRTATATLLTGEYSLAAGGINNAASTWNAPALRLQMSSVLTTEVEYFNTDYELATVGAADLDLTPGSVSSFNLNADLGELCLTVRSTGGNIYAPKLLAYENGIAPAPGNLNGWAVNYLAAFGWPTTAAEASTRNSLRTLLPAGTYVLRPSVGTVGAGGVLGTATLSAITVTIPARGRVCVDNGVSIVANAPICVGPNAISFGGTINSDGVAVKNIKYSLDNGGLVLLCSNCGVNPSFTVPLPAGLAPGDHTVTIYVLTDDGRTASTTVVILRDTTKPVITCPADIVIPDVPAPGQVVNYPAPVIIDACPVSLLCAPPSGSFFPLGDTTITCTATDQSGNVATCKFHIILKPVCPPPFRSHQYSGSADGHFTYQGLSGWQENAAMTLQAWVKRDDAARCETILSAHFTNSFWFGFCSGKLRFYRTGTFADADVDVPAGQWTHVAVSYDGTMASFFVDGHPAGIQPLSHGAVGLAPPEITIGADFSSGSSAYEFQGYLDEIQLYNIALSEFGINQYLAYQYRYPLPNDFQRSWGDGGSREDQTGVLGTTGAVPPVPQVEGILPRWLVVPKTTNIVGMDGNVNPLTEYSLADKMVIPYHDGAHGVTDAVAYFTYRDQPGDQALYIGVKGIRDVTAPWTRDKSWVGVQMEPKTTRFLPYANANARAFRYNSRRLDGSFGGGFGPAGGTYERGTGIGNFTALAPGDPLASESSFGLIGDGGTSVEFRFSKNVLGGDWRKMVRLSLCHYWLTGVGQDFASPGATYDIAGSWPIMVFAGQLPSLDLTSTFPGQMTVSWPDPVQCPLTLETSTLLTAGTWSTLTAARDDSTADGLFRVHQANTLVDPRRFFRLRR